MDDLKVRWQWDVRIPWLVLEGLQDGPVCLAGTLELAESDEGSAVIHCNTESTGFPVAEVEKYRWLAEVTASVLVPHGASTVCPEPRVANRTELEQRGLRVPSFLAMSSGLGVRQRARADEFAKAWSVLDSLPEGHHLLIAAQVLRWSDTAAHAGRPIEGFLFSWIACNALYDSMPNPPTSEQKRVKHWISDDSVVVGFVALYRSQWQSVRRWLSLLSKRDFTLRRGNNALHVAKDLELRILDTERYRQDEVALSTLKELAVATFLVIYALRNVVAHGKPVPPVRKPAVKRPADQGERPPADDHDGNGASLTDLCSAAGNLIRPVVRTYLKMSLLRRLDTRQQ